MSRTSRLPASRKPTPFFERFLEGQQTAAKPKQPAGPMTLRYPSDNETTEPVPPKPPKRSAQRA